VRSNTFKTMFLNVGTLENENKAALWCILTLFEVGTAGKNEFMDA